MISMTKIRSTRARRLSVEATWVGVGQILSVGGGLVGVRILTEQLTPAQYGELALGLTVGGLVTQLVFGPIQQGVLRFFQAACEVQEQDACFTAVQKLVRRASVSVFLVVAIVLGGLFLAGGASWLWLALIALLLSVVAGNERVFDSMQMASRHRGIVAWHQAILQWQRFIFAVALISWLGASSAVAMLGYLLATAVTLCSQIAFFRSRSGVHATPASPQKIATWMQQITRYAWPFASWGLFSWMQQASDRWSLQVASNAQNVGYYAVLVQLGYSPIILVTSSLVQLVQPVVFGRAGDGSVISRVLNARRLNFAVLIGFLGLTFVATACAALFYEPIFRLLAGPDYRGVSYLMPWMVLAGGLYATSEAAGLLLMTGISTKRLIIPKISISLVGIGANVIGAWWLGLPGVVAASLTFSTISLIWMLLLAHRVRHPDK